MVQISIVDYLEISALVLVRVFQSKLSFVGNKHLPYILEERKKWSSGFREGCVVGGNGRGEGSNQFNSPYGFSYDDENGLFAVDFEIKVE